MEIEIKDDDDIDYRGDKGPNLNLLDEAQREPRRSDNNKARIIQNLYKKKKRSPHRSYIIVSEAESDSDVSRYPILINLLKIQIKEEKTQDTAFLLQP